MKNKDYIKYVGFYGSKEIGEQRVAAISAVKKMNYIAESIIKTGKNVTIISPSWQNDCKKMFSFEGLINSSFGDIEIIVSPAFNLGSFLRNFKVFFGLAWLFFFLLFNTKQKEKILVYHSPWLYLPLKGLKILKRSEIILEVEEIYQEVWVINKTLKRWENKLLKLADSYITVSNVLAQKLGSKTKLTVYGAYSIQHKPDVARKKSDKIKVVYAGLIDHIKGGAFNAVRCCKYLPENYEMHIAGRGSLKEIEILKEEIEKINKIHSREVCVFHGTLPDEQFDNLLNSCHIAINPQIDGKNMEYLFPSKIIKYLAHNLRVVSTPIKSLVNSPFKNLVDFSIDDSPFENAKSILEIDLTKDFNSISVIDELNEKFLLDLKLLFI